MGSAMMIGVAQVMGMKPILRSFFSGGPGFAWARALAAPIGKTSASTAAAVPAPTVLRKSLRPPKTACSTERSTSLSMRASLLAGLSVIGSSHWVCFSALLREETEQTLCLTTAPIKSKSSTREVLVRLLQCPRHEQTRLYREHIVPAVPAYIVGMNETWALTTRHPSGMRTHV